MFNATKLVRKLNKKLSVKLGEAATAEFQKDYVLEQDLKKQAITLSKRISSYEVLLSKLGANEKINVRTLTYFERCKANYNLTV